MKKTWFLPVFMLLFSSLTQAQDIITISSFDWLIGTWQNLDSKPGETSTETWVKDPSGMLVGSGVTVNGSDTTFVESLKIIEKEGICFYVADVSQNAGPVYFKMKTADANSFLCENPQHDFPKQIAYHYDGEILTATISDDRRAMRFRFKRT